MTDAEAQALWEQWCAERPDHVRRVAERFPPNKCLRSKDGGRGHYCVVSFSDDEPVTLRILHGADSFLPGTQVYGVEPDSLVSCDCGQFKIDESWIPEECYEPEAGPHPHGERS